MRTSINRKIQWVEFFESHGINTNQFPLKVLKKQPWANSCEEIMVDPGKEFISSDPASKVDCIYMVIKGSVALGNYKYTSKVNFCVEYLNLKPYSILLLDQCRLKLDNLYYPSIPSPFDAWPSSETLCNLIAYSSEDKMKGKLIFKSERKDYGEKVFLLKIPQRFISKFIELKELQKLILHNAIHISKRLSLLPKKNKSTSSNVNETSLYYQLISLYNHCIINGICKDDTAYILAKGRLEAILQISDGPSKEKEEEKQSITEVFKRESQKTGIELLLKEISSDDLPHKFKSIFDLVNDGRGSNSEPYSLQIIPRK